MHPMVSFRHIYCTSDLLAADINHHAANLSSAAKATDLPLSQPHFRQTDHD